PSFHSFPTRRSSDLGVPDQLVVLGDGGAGPEVLGNVGIAVEEQSCGRGCAAVGVGLVHQAARRIVAVVAGSILDEEKGAVRVPGDRKSTRLNSSHVS